MRTYVCRACDGEITVGHPESHFKRKAKELARETASLLTRLLRPGLARRRYTDAMEERYYMEEHRYRELPDTCPWCGHTGRRDLPWWRPGAEYGK